MSSQKRDSDPNLEYQYTGEEIGAEDASLEAPQKPPSPFQVLKAKLLERLPKKKKYRVMLYIGIAIYVVYKFIHVDTPPANTKTTLEKITSQQLTKPTQEPPKEKPAEKKPVEKKAVEATKPVQPAAVTPITTATKDLYNAPSVDAEHEAKLKALQTSLDQANQSLTALESSLVNLTGSVIRLSKKVNSLEETHKNMPPAASGLWTYYLKSLVPGRAWVISPSGDYTTVKVGDSLPGYGRIQKIDVRASTILTSSGRIIQYGPNDS